MIASPKFSTHSAPAKKSNESFFLFLEKSKIQTIIRGIRPTFNSKPWDFVSSKTKWGEGFVLHSRGLPWCVLCPRFANIFAHQIAIEWTHCHGRDRKMSYTFSWIPAGKRERWQGKTIHIPMYYCWFFFLSSVSFSGKLLIRKDNFSSVPRQHPVAE